MESRKHKTKHSLIVIVFSVIVCIAISLLYKISQNHKYNQAKEFYSSGEYEKAVELFDDLGFYEDSLDFSVKASVYIEYEKAIDYLGIGKIPNKNADYKEAARIFASLGDFENSKYYWQMATFKYARQLYDNEEFDEAAKLFLSIIDDVDEESKEEAKTFYAKSMIPSVNDISETVYQSANKEYKEKDYIKAYKDFSDLNGYEDSTEWKEKCRAKLAQESLGHTISAGVRYSIAINNDKEIKITGDISSKNRNFLLSIENKEDIKSISGFSSIVAVLMESGKVAASVDFELDIDYIDSWSDIISIATGDQYIVGLDKDGNMFGAGHPNDGQINFEGWEKIISFDTSWRRTVGVDVDGKIYITGYGSVRHKNKIDEANYNAQNSNDEKIKKKHGII